jgi:hypothetical protein
VKQTKRNGKAKKCARYVKVPGALAHQGAAGANSLPWNARLDGRKLAASSYRMTAAPQGGERVIAAFTVVL